MWELILQCDDLLEYFPDMEPGRLPKRCFTFKILSTLKTRELEQLINEAREHRSITNTDEPEDLIEMDGAIKNYIFSILPQKST